ETALAALEESIQCDCLQREPFMSMEVVCGHCQGRLLIEQVGVVVACPHCGTHLRIDAPEQPESPAAAPAAASPPEPAPAPPAPDPAPTSSPVEPVEAAPPVEVAVPAEVESAATAVPPSGSDAFVPPEPVSLPEER